MSSIYESINAYPNIGNRKYTSERIYLQVGDKFSARIDRIDKENKEVLIKFLDGTTILANLDGELSNELLNVLSKFEVIKCDNEKLKLKVLKSVETKQERLSGENLNLENNNELEDRNNISKLVKYDIPVNKENLVKINSILDFLCKLQLNKDEGDKFIKNVLNARGINEFSSKGIDIKNLLNDFLASFKTMDEKEILTFIKNNIEFTKENIEAYKKNFNDKDGLSNFWTNIKSDVDIVNKHYKEKLYDKVLEKQSNINFNEKSIYNEGENKNSIEYAKGNIDNKNIKIENGENRLLERYNNSITVDYVKDSNESLNIIMKRFVNNKNVDLLNEFVNSPIIENDIYEKIIDSISEIDTKDSKNIKESIRNIISEAIDNKGSATNKELEVIDNKGSFINKELESSMKNLKNTYNIDLLKENINNKEDINYEKNINKEDVVKAEFKKIVDKNNLQNIELPIKEVIKEQIKDNTNNIRDIIKDIISNIKESDEGNISNRIAEVISKNIDSFKIFNNISENYYYMDIPLNLQNEDYQCKLIIKDDRGNGKKIDSKNVKMIVSVATVNIGGVDSYLTINNKSIQVDIKCNKEYVKMLEGRSSLLEEKILNIGLLPKVTVEEKREAVSLSNCNEFFNDMTISTLDLKV